MDNISYLEIGPFQRFQEARPSFDFQNHCHGRYGKIESELAVEGKRIIIQEELVDGMSVFDQIKAITRAETDLAELNL